MKKQADHRRLPLVTLCDKRLSSWDIPLCTVCHKLSPWFISPSPSTRSSAPLPSACTSLLPCGASIQCSMCHVSVMICSSVPELFLSPKRFCFVFPSVATVVLSTSVYLAACPVWPFFVYLYFCLLDYPCICHWPADHDFCLELWLPSFWITSLLALNWIDFC